MKLNGKQTAVVKAALIELDRAWRCGTANAGFQKRTMELLRGPTGPWPHESEAAFLLELMDRPGAEVHLGGGMSQPEADSSMTVVAVNIRMPLPKLKDGSTMAPETLKAALCAMFTGFAFDLEDGTEVEITKAE